MDWKDKALALHRAGISWRQIANKIGKAKSTVSDFLRPFKSGIVEGDPTRNGKTADIGVLLLDIETAPNLSYHWRMFKQDIPVQFTVRPVHILSFACKWLGNDKICVRGLPDFGLYIRDRFDDREIAEELYSILNAADVVVAHNLFGFDEKVMKSRFIKHGFAPLEPYMKVDTLQIAKNEFGFPSNKLDYLSRFFRIGKKRDHSGAQLWMDCLDGKDEAWKTMLDYNAQDVLLLEELYLKLRAWDRSHPNLSLIMPNDKPRCVTCGSDNIIETGMKKTYTKIGEFDNWVCLNCGKISRSRKSNKTREDRENILTNAR